MRNFTFYTPHLVFIGCPNPGGYDEWTCNIGKNKICMLNITWKAVALKRIWNDNIKMDLREIDSENVKWSRMMPNGNVESLGIVTTLVVS
jgi:hypothetical protein